MKHHVKKAAKKSPMSRAEKKEKEIMENPIEQNAENSSSRSPSAKKREQNNVERVEEEVEKMDDDMGE